MKKQNVVMKLVLFFIFILQLFYLKAQDVGLAWAKSMGGSGIDNGNSIVVDDSGKIYITGYFGGVVDFDPGMGISNLTSKGDKDIFIQKLDANGNFIWAKSMGGSGADNVNSMVVDDSGNTYTTGYFEGTVDFDPGLGTTNLTSKGSYDIFIQKLDANGNFVWAKSMGGFANDNVYSIAIDNSGNIYTTGYFEGTVDFNPSSSGTTDLISKGYQDIFIQKLDKNGNFIWAKSMGGSYHDRPYSIAIDNSGNIYTTGYFEGTVDFDPGVGRANLISKGVYDIFIQKLDKYGNFIWGKSIGGSDRDIGYSIVIDQAGNIYTTGYFQGTVDFDPEGGVFYLTPKGLDDIFIQKLDSNGNFVWAKSIGGSDTDFGRVITIDNYKNIYITGGFMGTVDFDPSTVLADTFNLTSKGYQDIFIQKLDINGNFVWAKTMGGTRSDNVHSVSVDDYGNIYTTGYFGDIVDFDPGLGVFNLTSKGLYDVFIQKLCPVDTIFDTVSVCSQYTYSGTTFNKSIDTAFIFTNRFGCDSVVALNLTVSLLNLNVGLDDTICPLENITLTATGAQGYTWSHAGSNNRIVSSNITTTYYVTGVDTIGINDTTICSQIDTVTIYVNPLPNVDAGSNQTICSGYNVMLSGIGANSYVWDKGVTNNVPFTLTTTQTYTLTGTDTNGCKNIDTVKVIVNPLPNVDAGSNQVICSGDSLTLNGTGADSYVWDKGVINNVTFTVATTQTYTLTGTDVNGCKNTDTVIVTANPLPNVDAGLNQTICSGDNVTLSGTGAYSYVWNKGVINNVPFTITTTQTYRLTGTDINGCESIDTVTVYINPHLSPNVDAGLNQTICSGDNVTLSGTGADSYVWNKGIIDNVAFIVTTTQTYRLTGTDTNGCKSTDTVTVTVNPLPNVDAGLNRTICSGDNVTLIGAGADTYVWDKGITNNVSFTLITTQTYIVTGTDVNGCENTDTVIVNVNQLPNVDAGLNKSICLGDNVMLSGAGANSYVWDKGVTNNVYFIPTTTQPYRLIGTDTNGCKNIDTVRVTVNPLPNVDAGFNKTICLGDSVILIGTGANSYVWDKGIINNISFIPTTTQIYRLTGTDVNGCKNTDTVYIKVKVTPFINFDSLYTFCEGDSILFKIQSDTQTVIWNNTYISDTYLVKETEKVFVEIFNNSNSCSFSDTLTFIKIDTIKQLNWFQDTVICIDSEIELILDKNVDIKTIWSDGYIGSSRKIDKSVDLCVTQSNICQTKEQCIHIFEIDCECTYYIPNIFTPNGDNLNEEFKPIISCDIEYEFEIFDRWGNTIFITNNKLDKGWNGKIGNQKVNGVYNWKFTRFENIDSSRGVTIEYGAVCIL